MDGKPCPLAFAFDATEMALLPFVFDATGRVCRIPGCFQHNGEGLPSLSLFHLFSQTVCHLGGVSCCLSVVFFDAGVVHIHF